MSLRGVMWALLIEALAVAIVAGALRVGHYERTHAAEPAWVEVAR